MKYNYVCLFKTNLGWGEGGVILPPLPPSWHFAGFSNISLEILKPNVVSLALPCLLILGKTQTEVFLISGFLLNPLFKKVVITPEPVMILR